jgi:PAS domain S-box-containing protein
VDPDPSTTAPHDPLEPGFRAVVERLDAIVYLEALDGPVGEPGAILYVSPQLEAILGYTVAEWTENPTAWRQHLHADDTAASRAAYERALASGEPYEAEYRMFACDGGVVWFRDQASVVSDDAGRPRYWQGTMVDITAERLGAARAHDSESRYRTLVEQLPAIVYSEDVTGDGLQVVYINSRVEELLGISPQAWVADPSIWLRAIHPEDRPAVEATNKRTERTGEPFSAEYRMFATDGRTVWFRDEAVLVHGVDGEPKFWQGVMMDITPVKEAQAQLAETESRYRALVEQMPTITYIDALEGSVNTIYISPQTTTLLGYTPEDWYADAQLWSKIVHPDDAERAAHNGPDTHDSTYRIIARDGHEVWVHDQARLIHDDAGAATFWQGVLVDITGQKRAEALEHDLADERAASDRLRENDELKNTFLQAVSHDLRTPLAAILGIAATLERPELDLPVEESRELAGRIVANARRLDRMVADILDLDRLARGSIMAALAPVDVGHLVRELVAGSDLVAGRRLQLDTAPITIRGDGAMIERIVENLLGNTAKHTPGDARIWVRVERLDGGVVIAVEDDGPGIAPEDRARIFEAFAQGHSPARASGVGVGLAVVARFAELHGGRAWVTEREGGGASFRVLLSPDVQETSSDQPESQPATAEY